MPGNGAPPPGAESRESLLIRYNAFLAALGVSAGNVVEVNPTGSGSTPWLTGRIRNPDRITDNELASLLANQAVRIKVRTLERDKEGSPKTETMNIAGYSMHVRPVPSAAPKPAEDDDDVVEIPAKKKKGSDDLPVTVETDKRKRDASSAVVESQTTAEPDKKKRKKAKEKEAAEEPKNRTAEPPRASGPRLDTASPSLDSASREEGSRRASEAPFASLSPHQPSHEPSLAASQPGRPASTLPTDGPRLPRAPLRKIPLPTQSFAASWGSALSNDGHIRHATSQSFSGSEHGARGASPPVATPPSGLDGVSNLWPPRPAYFPSPTRFESSHLPPNPLRPPSPRTQAFLDQARAYGSQVSDEALRDANIRLQRRVAELEAELRNMEEQLTSSRAEAEDFRRGKEAAKDAKYDAIKKLNEYLIAASSPPGRHESDSRSVSAELEPQRPIAGPSGVVPAPAAARISPAPDPDPAPSTGHASGPPAVPINADMPSLGAKKLIANDVAHSWRKNPSVLATINERMKEEKVSAQISSVAKTFNAKRGLNSTTLIRPIDARDFILHARGLRDKFHFWPQNPPPEPHIDFANSRGKITAARRSPNRSAAPARANGPVPLDPATASRLDPMGLRLVGRGQSPDGAGDTEEEMANGVGDERDETDPEQVEVEVENGSDDGEPEAELEQETAVEDEEVDVDDELESLRRQAAQGGGAISRAASEDSGREEFVEFEDSGAENDGPEDGARDSRAMDVDSE